MSAEELKSTLSCSVLSVFLQFFRVTDDASFSVALGNQAFSAKNFEEAVLQFSKAIEVDPGNHVLYSNRSASYASLKQYDKALDDANKTVELKPDWPKGYSRKGAALLGLKSLEEAKA